MTNEQLLALDLALKQILLGQTQSTELLSWTLTYLVKHGDTVIMKTIFIPEIKK